MAKGETRSLDARNIPGTRSLDLKSQRLLISAFVSTACLVGASAWAADPAPAAKAPAAAPAPAGGKKALRIAYSDWPGWTAFEVAIQKGWFKEEGVDVEFSWFDYLPSLDAFSAGKVDAVAVTNGDALVNGAHGAKSKFILLNDYSNGNDQIIVKPGIKSFPELKGKKIGVELTLVDHLLLLQALKKFKMQPSDVELVNFPTNETPQALASGGVSAIAAWYPISGQARKAVAGAKAVFTSADVPGLIYDTIAVNPTSLSQHKAEWAKVVKVWYRVSDFVRNPKTQKEAVAIMAAKVGVKPEEYAAALPGTFFLPLAEAKKRYKKGDGLDSIYGSTKLANEFNVTNSVYKVAEPIDDYIFPDFVLGM
jgi:NitT/TauT family transport system substrate-binding protein